VRKEYENISILDIASTILRAMEFPTSFTKAKVNSASLCASQA